MDTMPLAKLVEICKHGFSPWPVTASLERLVYVDRSNLFENLAGRLEWFSATVVLRDSCR